MSLIAKAAANYYEAARQPKFDPKELRLSETGDCARKRAYKALGYEVTHPIKDDALKAMEAGNLWEAWLIDRICAVWPDVDTQVTVQTPYGAGGHIDAVLRGPVDPAPLIVEVKAINQWTPASTLPKAEHVDQVQAYLHFYGRQHGIGKANLVYIHRENGAGPFEHPIAYDPERGARIEDALRCLSIAVEHSILPNRADDMQAGKYPCSWTSKTGGGHCQFYGHCWSEPNTD